MHSSQAALLATKHPGAAEGTGRGHPGLRGVCGAAPAAAIPDTTPDTNPEGGAPAAAVTRRRGGTPPEAAPLQLGNMSLIPNPGQMHETHQSGLLQRQGRPHTRRRNTGTPDGDLMPALSGYLVCSIRRISHQSTTFIFTNLSTSEHDLIGRLCSLHPFRLSIYLKTRRPTQIGNTGYRKYRLLERAPHSQRFSKRPASW